MGMRGLDLSEIARRIHKCASNSDGLREVSEKSATGSARVALDGSTDATERGWLHENATIYGRKHVYG
jgi:hypothetical protein